MRGLVIVAALLAVVPSLADDLAPSPQLLLTPQRLKRLKRERERQSERWSFFEKRVLSVPDSSERGFELALYYAVTGDPQQAKAATAWALQHPCDRRQAALVVDWAGSAMSEAQRSQIANASCMGGPLKRQFAQMRDALFWQVLRHETPQPGDVRLHDVPSADEMYALAEYLDAYRATQSEDLRHQDVPVYLKLPAAVLLAMHPKELEHPSWQQHAAALALVSIDPNIQASQFLQGWAMEDRFEEQSGPGVGYDLLWADEYLPGVGYQNMEPWVAWDGEAALWLRKDWSSMACWTHVSARGIDQENCAPDWMTQPVTIGRLQLIPLTDHCTQLPERMRGVISIVKTTPGSELTFVDGKDKRKENTNAAGLWTVPEGVSGKICSAKTSH